MHWQVFLVGIIVCSSGHRKPAIGGWGFLTHDQNQLLNLNINSYVGYKSFVRRPGRGGMQRWPATCAHSTYAQHSGFKTVDNNVEVSQALYYYMY